MNRKYQNLQQYLQPEFVSTLKNLDFVARMIVEGFLVGLHKSPYHGFSVEFAEHRQYMPGDDIKHIDWKATARAGKTIVKQYKDEYFSRYGLILDSYVPKNYSQAFEEAVSVAASIMMAQDTKDAVLDLFFVGSKCITCSVGRGLTNQQRMLEILASVTTCQDQQFKEMTDLVKHHSSLLSGVVVILIDLDEDRKKLINYLISNKIPCKVIVIVENHEEYRAKIEKLQISAPIRIININHVEEDISLL